MHWWQQAEGLLQESLLPQCAPLWPVHTKAQEQVKRGVPGRERAREQLSAGVRVVRDAAEVLHDGLIELCAPPRRHPADEDDVAAQPGVLCLNAPAQDSS